MSETVQQAANRCGVTAGYVQQLIVSKRLKAEKEPGGPNGFRYVLKYGDLDRVLAGMKHRGRPRIGGAQ